jgi:hypothetical protein
MIIIILMIKIIILSENDATDKDDDDFEMKRANRQGLLSRILQFLHL